MLKKILFTNKTKQPQLYLNIDSGYLTISPFKFLLLRKKIKKNYPSLVFKILIFDKFDNN